MVLRGGGLRLLASRMMVLGLTYVALIRHRLNFTTIRWLSHCLLLEGLALRHHHLIRVLWLACRLVSCILLRVRLMRTLSHILGAEAVWMRTHKRLLLRMGRIEVAMMHEHRLTQILSWHLLFLTRLYLSMHKTSCPLIMLWSSRSSTSLHSRSRLLGHESTTSLRV